jgi:adenosylcobinamide-GDP ribazoletransferase
MRPVRELAVAVGLLTVARGLASGASRETLAAALAFYPLVGLALGAVAAVSAALIAPFAPGAAGPIGVLVLAALGGVRGPLGLAAAAGALVVRGDPPRVLARWRARPRAAGLTLAVMALTARALAAATLPPPARASALLVAPLLGAWAIVVQCYGGSPGHARGPAAPQVGRARFREFGWASLTAFAVTLTLGEAVGLLVVVTAALVTVGIRVWAHRRVGGLTGRLLAATREVVETAVLGLLGLLAAASAGIP